MKPLAIVAVTVLLASRPGVAFAQAKQPASGWELDLSGGVSRTSAPTMTSTGNVVPDGPIFTAPGIIVQGVHSVSTWLLSNSSAFVVPGIQSLTSVTQTPGISGHSLGTFAVHATDWRSPTFGVEFGLSYGIGAATSFSDSTVSNIQQSASSFQNVFNAIFAAAPSVYGNPAVSAMLSNANHAGGQLIFTGGVVLAGHPSRTVPYGTLGLGIRAPVGSDPSVTLTGTYSFMAPGGVPINETDQVSLRYHTSNAAVFAFGAGVRHWVTDHSGLLVDFRATAGSETTTVHVSVTPTSTPATPGGFVVQQPAAGNATIVFSNTSSQRTSLSGLPLSDLTTSSASGFRFQWAVTAGWFWRF